MRLTDCTLAPDFRMNRSRMLHVPCCRHQRMMFRPRSVWAVHIGNLHNLGSVAVSISRYAMFSYQTLGWPKLIVYNRVCLFIASGQYNMFGCFKCTSLLTEATQVQQLDLTSWHFGVHSSDVQSNLNLAPASKHTWLRQYTSGVFQYLMVMFEISSVRWPHWAKVSILQFAIFNKCAMTKQ